MRGWGGKLITLSLTPSPKQRNGDGRIILTLSRRCGRGLFALWSEGVGGVNPLIFPYFVFHV
jgi:hypothetical protein